MLINWNSPFEQLKITLLCYILSYLCTQESQSADTAIVPQPCLLAVGSITDTIPTVKLVIERKVLIESVPAKQALLVLLGAFYTFNMHYTDGCYNFYKALEIIFLNIPNKDLKRLKLNRFLATVDFDL